MQKLLATSAIAMIALSGAAFAQALNTGADADFTVVDDNSNINAGDSLLTQILNQSLDVQVNMLNAAENLANLDGSINVLESANVDELLAEITASVGFGDGQELYVWELPNGTVQTGTQAQYEAAVAANDTYTWSINGGATVTGTAAQYQAAATGLGEGDTITAPTPVGVDLVEVNANDDTFAGLLKGVSQTVDGTTAIDFFDPALTVDALQTSVSNLTTTVIGALNTGVIGQNSDTGIAANTLAMANMQLESVAQTTGSLANSAQYFEPGDLQLANLATNMATVVDACVNVDQLMANVDSVATTLIGALNTGDIATDVNQNASNLTQAIVGQ
jgi:uncharacterized membrane protein YuzA (DUF378 family)